jgi:peptidoglycan/LPS O-acetylase OafA/YrhL
MKKERIFYIDFIRALSVIIIVVYHFNCSLLSHSIKALYLLPKFSEGNDLGTIGVSLFFIISGFALMYTYNDKFSIKDFFRKRFFTLFPLFWLAYGIAFLYFFYINCSINRGASKISFLLTIFGMDGYFFYKINDFYILGEWFLGCIILLYLCFPILRLLLLKYPKRLFIFIILLYFFVVHKYIFRMEIDRNILTRLPEFVFGMYFAQYIKKLNIFGFIGSIAVFIVFLFVNLNINYMYKITVVGISLFMILTFIGQHTKFGKASNLISLISKYSYGVFLVHHVIIDQLLNRFNGRLISSTETLCLFILVCIVIAITTNLLYKLYNFLGINAKKLILD